MASKKKIPSDISEENPDPFRDTLQKILYGNLGAWKDAIAAQDTKGLKAFLMGELERMEEEILDGVTYFRKADAHQNTRKLLDTNIEALALLKTVADMQGNRTKARSPAPVNAEQSKAAKVTL